MTVYSDFALPKRTRTGRVGLSLLLLHLPIAALGYWYSVTYPGGSLESVPARIAGWVGLVSGVTGCALVSWAKGRPLLALLVLLPGFGPLILLFQATSAAMAEVAAIQGGAGGTLLSPAERLRACRDGFRALRSEHGRSAVVVGGEQATGVLERIASVCDDAIRAIEGGVDRTGRPIRLSQIADGLRSLVGDARSDIGVVATVLTPVGVELYGEYLAEVDRVAGAVE